MASVLICTGLLTDQTKSVKVAGSLYNMVLLAFTQVSSDGASLDVICPLRDLNQNFIQAQTVIGIVMILFSGLVIKHRFQNTL